MALRACEVMGEATAETAPGTPCEARVGKGIRLSSQPKNRAGPSLVSKRKKVEMGLDMTSHACNNSTRKAEAGALH